jgi:hypothetical protein
LHADNFSEIRAKQGEAITQGAGDRQKVWDLLIDETREIRQQMEAKYKVDFDTAKLPGR